MRSRTGCAHKGSTRCGSSQVWGSDLRACEGRPRPGNEEFVEDEQVALLFDEGQDGVNIDECKMGMETDKDLQKVLTGKVCSDGLDWNVLWKVPIGARDWQLKYGDETFRGVRGLLYY
ncbi:hypothetical protein NDU88_001293 [Pleurodeles waltl]|uniref:Uncharacterized protein n=1 Tax=Pleurodeles waltl TaxID=8319 RepID=A0AAV7V7F1_PLEWA|nr:hypothetical protein NDU88_001293 [Pleurodeles waltl]